MEFCTEVWASHKKGAATRGKILEAILSNPGINKVEIALSISRTPEQVDRQAKKLMIEGKIHRKGKSFFPGSVVLVFLLLFIVEEIIRYC